MLLARSPGIQPKPLPSLCRSVGSGNLVHLPPSNVAGLAVTLTALHCEQGVRLCKGNVGNGCRVPQSQVRRLWDAVHMSLAAPLPTPPRPLRLFAMAVQLGTKQA